MTGCGDEKDKASIRKLAMLTCGKFCWEEFAPSSLEILVEVEHVRAHRTMKDEKDESHFEKFVTDGDEKADELAKEGAMLDEGIHGGSKIKDSPAGARRGVRSLAVRSQLSLFGGEIERL